MFAGMNIKTLFYKLIPVRFERQTFIVVIGDSITFLSTFLGLMILARILPIEEMGTYRQITYLGLMFVSLFDMSLSASIYRFWTIYDESKKKEFLQLVLFTSFILAGTASVILALLASPLSELYHNPSLAIALRIASVFPLTYIPFSLIRPVMISEGYSFKATLLETVASVLTTMAIIIPSFLHKSFLFTLSIWISISFLKTIFTIYFFRKYIFCHFKWPYKNILSDTGKYSGTLQISRIPGFLLNYSDKIVTSFFLSTKEFAVYSMGARELPFINTIGYSVSNVTVPYLVNDFNLGNIAVACSRWRTAGIKTARYTYPIIVFGLWYAIPLMKLLFSSTYEESGAIFRVFALTSFLRVVEYAGFAKAMDKTLLIIQSALLAAMAMIVFSIPLVYLYKGVGMAWAYFISTLISAVFLLIKYKKIIKMPIESFFSWKQLSAMFILATAIVVIIDKSLGTLLKVNSVMPALSLLWRLFILLLIDLIIFNVLLARFKTLKREER